MIFAEPFLHIIQENAIENPIELSKKIYSSSKWIPDPQPDLCPEIYHAEHTKWHRRILAEFETKEQAEYLFNTFKIDIPKKHRFVSVFQLQKKGGQLDIHTDYNQSAYNDYKKELKLDGVIHSITQHIYLPDTNQYPETGAIFHKEQKNIEIGSVIIVPVKQIKCLPGTYFAYVNSEISHHSVPKQKHEFNRIIWVSRLIW